LATVETRVARVMGDGPTAPAADDEPFTK
jgi:hypothetical protein